MKIMQVKSIFFARNVIRNMFNGESALKYCISPSDNKDYAYTLCEVDQHIYERIYFTLWRDTGLNHSYINA